MSTTTDTTKTADLYDDFSDEVNVAAPVFRAFGRREAFSGPVATLKVFEDNTMVRAALETPGDGRVLVVDGGGSLRCALVGDKLARLAIDNGWSGLIINGCIRDSGEINRMDIGIKALAAHPAKSAKRGEGQEDIAVAFAGVTFAPGRHVYADADGIVVADEDLVAGDAAKTVLT